MSAIASMFLDVDDDDIFTPPSSVTNLDDEELGCTSRQPATPVPPPSDERLRAMNAKIAALMEKLSTGTATIDDRRRMAELGARMESLAKSAVSEKLRTRTAMKKALRTKEKEVRFAERRKEIRSALIVYEKAEKVNLLFMMDATGSMASHIAAVKTQIQEIVENMRRSHAGIQLHVGFLAYRDHCDDGKRFEIQPFTKDINQFQSFVGALAATGGGDTAEDIHGALKAAGEQEWATGGAETRVLIHIGDAPCHGSQYHDGCDDRYPDGDPHGLQAANLFRQLQDLRVEYTFGRINSSTDKMVEEFNRELGGEPYITTCEVQDTKTVTANVTASLRASIAKTASALHRTEIFGFAGAAGSAVSSRSTVSLRSYTIEKKMPAWHTISPQTVSVYSNKPVTMEQLQRRGFGFLGWGTVEPTDGTEKGAVRVKIAPNPFAHGELRLARYARIITEKGSTPHVLKEFKVTGDGVHTLESYLRQIEVSTISAYLAQEYNEIKELHCKPIKFLRSHAVSVNTPHGKRFYNLERMLPAGSKFTKFSNNVGYWDEEEFDETLARFSQWTHEITHGYMMVVDLQGVKTDKGFTLTDPVLHCKDVDRFGSTNLGELGMDRCLKALRAYI